MSDNKKYYYLKLKENFFDSDALVVLESRKDGYLYSNILLKMYLKSLKNEGRLTFNDLIPYNAEMLATLTRHQVKTIERALEMFKTLGLIEILDNGIIYMADIQNFIGKSSSEADRQREYQKRIASEKQTLSGTCKNSNKKTTPEIEIEKEIEIDIEIEKKDNNMSADADVKTALDFQTVLKLFNSVCVSLPKATKLNDNRKRQIKNAYKQLNGDFESFFRRVENSDFLSGRTGNWKGCCFDWILKDSNLIKIIEGNYDNKADSQPESRKTATKKDYLEGWT